MLEIRKNTFSKNYENSFFREFSRHLYKSFKEKNLSGVLVGSPLCEVDERLQIDALLITPSVVCIIDFKNIKGKIQLPAENDFACGLWTTENGEPVKGGSSINPFMQLKKQKGRFIEVSNKYIQTQLSPQDIFNPYHVVRIVCFQEEVEIAGKIPNSEALNFFIIDKASFIEVILDVVDVADKDIILSESSYDAFKKIFRADHYKFDDKPLEDKLKDIASQSALLDYDTLYDDQRAALSEIKSFLENAEQQVFVLQGTANSGKTNLVPFIQDVAYRTGVQETELFAVSSRVARNLLSSSGLESVNSIYSFIYGGHKTVAEENDVNKQSLAENEELGIPDELILESVPLKKCDNTENALFIVDEAQLVSDSYHQSIDLVFGTGCLLRDLLEFSGQIDWQSAREASSKRKIIFIGDPYQLQMGKASESPMNPAYLEETYKLKTACFQLIDKEDYSDINRQALNCVKGIKLKTYNVLRFTPGASISILSENDKLPCLSEIITKNIDGHILTYSQEKSQEINKWIKKAIIQTGEDLSSKDLVLFNNNISVEDENDPFAEPKKIYNGQFATVISASNNIISESVEIKKQAVILNFREVTLQLNDSGSQSKVLSLENYRLNPKAELSKFEIIAFKIILNSQLRKQMEANTFEKSNEYLGAISSKDYHSAQHEINELKKLLESGERVKGKLEEYEIELRKILRAAKQRYKYTIESSLRRDPSTKYYKYKNAAFLRFGWAMTVHKSMSYKWNEVVFDVYPGESVGRNNENHFRWLYTGISRARQKVSFVNYRPINPFDKAEFKDNNGVKPKDVYFVSNKTDLNEMLSEFRQFVQNKLINTQYNIVSIEHNKYQETITLQTSRRDRVTISVYYNNDGKFKYPKVMKSESKELGQALLDMLSQKAAVSDFSFIKDQWRKVFYDSLSMMVS